MKMNFSLQLSKKETSALLKAFNTMEKNTHNQLQIVQDLIGVKSFTTSEMFKARVFGAVSKPLEIRERNYSADGLMTYSRTKGFSIELEIQGSTEITLALIKYYSKISEIIVNAIVPTVMVVTNLLAQTELAVKELSQDLERLM